jgi:hypothetical protein
MICCLLGKVTQEEHNDLNKLLSLTYPPPLSSPLHLQTCCSWAPQAQDILGFHINLQWIDKLMTWLQCSVIKFQDHHCCFHPENFIEPMFWHSLVLQMNNLVKVHRIKCQNSGNFLSSRKVRYRRQLEREKLLSIMGIVSFKVNHCICMETMRKTWEHLGHTVSKLRFKTGNYDIWSSPILANSLLVISHKYTTTDFLSGVSCSGFPLVSHNFLTCNPHTLHHSQPAMHNFSMWNPHTWLSTWYTLQSTTVASQASHKVFVSKYPCPQRQRKKQTLNWFILPCT